MMVLKHINYLLYIKLKIVYVNYKKARGKFVVQFNGTG